MRTVGKERSMSSSMKGADAILAEGRKHIYAGYGRVPFPFLMRIKACKLTVCEKQAPFLFLGIYQIGHLVPVFFFGKELTHNGIKGGFVIVFFKLPLLQILFNPPGSLPELLICGLVSRRMMPAYFFFSSNRRFTSPLVSLKLSPDIQKSFFSMARATAFPVRSLAEALDIPFIVGHGSCGDAGLLFPPGQEFFDFTVVVISYLRSVEAQAFQEEYGVLLPGHAVGFSDLIFPRRLVRQ